MSNQRTKESFIKKTGKIILGQTTEIVFSSLQQKDCLPKGTAREKIAKNLKEKLKK